MKYLYLLIDLLAIAGPIALSFDKRVAFYKQWKYVLTASLIIAIPFLLQDAIFTTQGFWGFNPEYLTGIYIGNLPLEEILFFFVVPFSCYFIYACIKYYLRHLSLKWLNRLVQIGIALYVILIYAPIPKGWYTITILPTSIIVLYIWIRSAEKTHAGLAFLISMLPFFLMNGALTGLFTDEPVVWYNESEKQPGRIFTIPYEDVLYAFTLIISVFLLADKLQGRAK